MVVAPIAAGREADLRALLSSMNAAPGMADPRNAILPFGAFERLHFARLVVLDDALQADLQAHTCRPTLSSSATATVRRTTRSPTWRSARSPGCRESSNTA